VAPDLQTFAWKMDFAFTIAFRTRKKAAENARKP
jgi:hypothetical protein